MMLASNLIKYLKIANEANNLFRTSMDITFVEFQILHEIFENEGAHINQLGMGRNVTHQGVGKHCANLEAMGLAQIRRDDRDQRAKKVYITKKGVQVLTDCVQQLEDNYGAKVA